MIQQIITMLQMDNFYGESEFIDIAKGKYKLNTAFKKILKQEIRKIKSVK
jgi:hypothetical protein